MKIVITTKKPLYAVGHANRLQVGVPIEVSDHLGKFYIERGDAVAYEVKEQMDRPSEADGAAASSSALPLAQASQPQTSSLSDSGDSPRKRGRPRKSEE
jgi:hypothetical protein